MVGKVLPNQDLLNSIFAKYGLTAVYLFGSRADGTAMPESDYDFGLLFKETPSFEDAVLLELDIANESSKVLKAKVDTIILNTASIEMRFIVIKQGTVIYVDDDDLRSDFEDVAIRDYLDFKPFLDTYRREVRDAIKEGGFYA